MSATAVPITVGVQLGHAAVQLVCERAGVDVLHIKGPAVDARLERQGSSTDADVLVRPGQQDRLLAELVRNGWRIVTGFEDGSAFHHAAALWHTYLGYVDVHRIFPGFELPADQAFEILWKDRGQTQIAHRDCWVPSLTAQRVMLVLHTARGGRGTDLQRAWHDASQAERDEIAVLVDRLQARVAFDIALGRLDTNLDAASHDLWQLYATGRQSDRWAEWGARFRAASGVRGKLREFFSMLKLNRGHLEMELGRIPTRRDHVRAYLRRIRRAVVQLWGRLR